MCVDVNRDRRCGFTLSWKAASLCWNRERSSHLKLNRGLASLIQPAPQGDPTSDRDGWGIGILPAEAFWKSIVRQINSEKWPDRWKFAPVRWILPGEGTFLPKTPTNVYPVICGLGFCETVVIVCFAFLLETFAWLFKQRYNPLVPHLFVRLFDRPDNRVVCYSSQAFDYGSVTACTNMSSIR